MTNTTIVLERERLEKRLPLGAPDSGRRYLRGEMIAKGGQGEVYCCHDEMLDREVAVKFLRRDLMGSREAETRIVREARLMAQMNIPGVPNVHDIDRSVIGCPFFAMTLVPSINLRHILHGIRHGDCEVANEYPLERLVEIVGQVAEILSSAHPLGIVHQDLKPENILVDQWGTAWLIDWGSAEMVDQATDRRSEFLGSPAYAAPEQVRGDAANQSSDIYGIGTVLYDCLALDTLIKAKTRSAAIADVLRGDHVWPSQSTLRGGVPRVLEEVCMRAVSLDPSDRFSTMQSLSDAIRDGLNDLLTHPELETAFELGAGQPATV